LFGHIGDSERVKGAKVFTDMTEEVFAELSQSVLELSLKESWVTADRRVGSGQYWLYVILDAADC
jgi:hypothetical protein